MLKTTELESGQVQRCLTACASSKVQKYRSLKLANKLHLISFDCLTKTFLGKVLCCDCSGFPHKKLVFSSSPDVSGSVLFCFLHFCLLVKAHEVFFFS